MTGTHDVSALLARVNDRVPLDGHDGRSGATLERGVLDDGRRVIVKTVAPDHDITFALGGEPTGRERRLWEARVLDDLPPGIGHALLGAGWVDGLLVTVMSDLGSAVLTWDRLLSADDLDRIFGALAAMHRRFADQAPVGLCDLRRRAALFAPDRFVSLAADHELVPAVLAGWEHFVETVPHAIADTVLSTLRQPEDLAAVLASGVSTLCHGDAWLVNMAITRNEVVLLDWNLATHGPASLDFVDFVVGCAAHIDLPDDVVLSKARDACRDLVEDTVWHATLFWALCELGWNKALDATTHPDHNERARARRELQWWVEQADRALQAM